MPKIRCWPRLLFWFATLALLALVAGFLHHRYREQAELIAAQHLVALDVAYRASIETHRLDVETRYRTQILRPELLDLMAEALATPEPVMPPLRGRLYRLMHDVHEELEQAGLRQFAFHLADDRVLLRFHMPELAGDAMFALRPTLRIACLEQRPANGLEVGRNLPGYRYVFPLARAGKMLGCVELSLPFDRLHEQLRHLLPAESIMLLLRRDELMERVNAEYRDKYADAALHAGFVVEHPTVSRVVRNFVQSAMAAQLDPLLRADAEVGRRMAAGDSFTRPVRVDGRGYVVAFLAIADADRRPVGHVVSYSEVPALVALYRNHLRDALLALLLLTSAAYAGWLVLLSRQSLRREVTERQKAEQAVIEVLATVPCAVYVVDRDGKIDFLNAEAERLLGFTAEQARGRDSHALFHDRHPDGQPYAREDCPLHRAMSEGGRHELQEDHVITADGRFLPVWITASPLWDGDRVRGGVVAFLDIGDRKRAEQAMRQAMEQTERADRAKSEFLANMSHEIRTPMNAIIGLSGLALDLPGIDARLRDYLAKILSSSKALLAILNDILDYSKIEAGRLELEQREFRLEELLQNVADLFSVRAEEKGLELVIDVAPDLPPCLRGDALRLGQVLNNLVGNAVKFTAAGYVRLQATPVAGAKTDEAGTAIEFSVSDTGIGISPEQLERLFSPFVQADGSISRRYGGTGLGLVISQRLVERMGGELRVASTPGQGSRFSFVLELPAVAAAEPVRVDRQALRVLVVDDLAASRQVLVEALQAWGYTVQEEADGEAALAAVRAAAKAGSPFDLVLLDWRMPGIDGLGVARTIGRMAAEGELAALPVVMMVTAYSRDRLLAEADDLKPDAVLTKPVTPSRLFDAIAEARHARGHRVAATPQPQQLRRAAPFAGVRVLLVEDNEINQTVGRDLLERLGLQVSVAANGAEALAQLADEEFAAVLMDLQMPVMDGFEATRRLRAEPRWASLPVIAMTAAVLPRDREACFAAGMNGYVGKPIDVDELVGELARWLPVRADAEEGVEAAGADSERPLPGFDVRAALARLDVQRALLERLVLMFVDQFADADARLQAHLAAGDWTAALALTHEIKGAAANLGARRLSEAARALEAAIKEMAPAKVSPAGTAAQPSAAVGNALTGFSAALAEIRQARAVLAATGEPPQDATECAACDWQGASPVLAELDELLAGNDYVPPEMLVMLQKQLPCTSVQQRLALLAREIAAADYPRARQTLQSLSCGQGHPLRPTKD